MNKIYQNSKFFKNLISSVILRKKKKNFYPSPSFSTNENNTRRKKITFKWSFPIYHFKYTILFKKNVTPQHQDFRKKFGKLSKNVENRCLVKLPSSNGSINLQAEDWIFFPILFVFTEQNLHFSDLPAFRRCQAMSHIKIFNCFNFFNSKSKIAVLVSKLKKNDQIDV